ncbi:transcriptional regulator NrdR [Adlercreutzia faecimuris]|uniref:Transcriptional repressor NrdR n=1 Tax=Adlercreutzia faecimuris TaxID=2897341 RepID=A0ABS9WI53_9ACTN|nr:transcriptional regulator NrdR [Adlercreutzia sp. JBNU-10]MCI2241957.1 transcriptional regulator NrdR [Adlercreutzia sp. JBNU-10]
MLCPACGHPESKVVDSRPADDGAAIRRRRECLSCGHRFTTYERRGENPVIVIKSDGSSEAFDRQKLMRGLLSACAKRPVTPHQMESLINGIENDLSASPRGEIRSKDLGDMVMARLAPLDDVAYIRFMSVYKDFQSVEEFAEALNDIS